MLPVPPGSEEGMLEDLNHHPQRSSPDPSSCELESEFVVAMCRQLQNEVFSSGKRPLDQLDADPDESHDDAYLRLRNKNKSPRRSEEGDGGLLLPNGIPSTTHHRHQPRDDEICGSDSLIPALGPDLSVDCLVRCSRSDFGTLSLLNRGFRSLIRSGEIYRMRRRRSIVEHWVYFSCHGLQWDAFDPYRSRWMQLPVIPQDVCFMCSDKESLAVGTELLVFGKVVHSHVVLRYSLLTNSWTPGKEMNTPRCLFGSASLGEIAIVAGGCSSIGAIYASAELYDSEKQTWTSLPDMNVPRKMCSGFFMDGRFYVVGGMGTNGRPLTCGEEFDLGTRTWRVIPDMFPALFGGATGAPPLVAVVNNQLYAADYSAKVLRRYAKPTNTWLTLGPLPERSVTTNGWGFAFRACGESLVVIGGPSTLSGGIIEFSSWVPTTDQGEEGSSSPQWDLIGRKPSGCFVYNCAVMGC